MQSFQHWQQSPVQGAIPPSLSDTEHLEIIKDNLLEALGYLTFCQNYLELGDLGKRYSALSTAVADSLNSCNQAIEHCEDQPDE